MKTRDLKTFSVKLQEMLKSNLETIRVETTDPVGVACKSFEQVKSSLMELKKFIHNYSFTTRQEEVSFFKEIKPLFMSQYYYYEHMLGVKINEPIGGKESMLRFYNQKLKHIRKQIKKQAELHTYCLTNSTHLDDKFFIRGTNTNNPNEDEQFSSSHDNTLALLLANQMMRDYLESIISKTDTPVNTEEKTLLTWTGPKTHLIELIYALHLTEAVNKGNTDLKQIASTFERVFNINLGNFYRVLQEIKCRKNDQAFFLTQLKEKFTQRIDELDQN